MYKCPHCGMPGISVWRKLNIGLYNPTICKQCGNKVGIPYYVLFIMIPFIITTVSIVLFVVDNIVLIIAICVVGTLIWSGIFLKYVPLVPKYK